MKDILLVERLHKGSLSPQNFIQYLSKFSRRILRRPLKWLFQIISTSLQYHSLYICRDICMVVWYSVVMWGGKRQPSPGNGKSN